MTKEKYMFRHEDGIRILIIKASNDKEAIENFFKELRNLIKRTCPFPNAGLKTRIVKEFMTNTRHERDLCSGMWKCRKCGYGYGSSKSLEEIIELYGM